MLKKDEFIGLEAKIMESTCSSYLGINGRVMDETMHMLILKTEDGRIVKIPKSGNKFEFSGKEVIDGEEIDFRPEDRIKKCH